MVRTLTTHKKTDNVRFVENLGVSLSHITGNEAYLYCPFHRDNHASLCVSLKDPLWYCHAASHEGKRGGHLNQLKKLLDNTKLYEETEDDLLARKEKPEEVYRVAKLYVKDFPGLVSASNDKYLLDRGFTSETLTFWDIRKTTLFIVVPTKDEKGNVVGLIIRALLNGWKPKYQYSYGFARNKYLFGVDKFKPKDDIIILVEGCFPASTKIICENKNRKIGSTGGAGHLLVNRSIESISIGDKVLSFNERTHEKELKLVTQVFTRNSRDLIKLKFSNGNELDCTPNHPIATNVNGNIIWIPASELVVGSECVQYKYDGLNRRFHCFELAKNRTNKSLNEIFGAEKAKEMCSKNSKSNIGRKPWNKGIIFSDYFSKEVSGEIFNKWSKSKVGNKNSIGPRSHDTKNKNSLASKKMWKNPDIANKILVAQRKSPNNTEILIKKFLEKEFPNKFEINTNGEIVKKYKLDTDGLSPDFIWVSGKKIILFNGCSWHCCKECERHHPRKLSDEFIWRRDEDVIARLKKKGWKVLVIWHHDLIDLEKLYKKVADFIYNPNSEIVLLTSKIYERNYGKKVYNLTVEDNNNYFAYGILVHNSLDAIKCQQNGFTNTLAVLGSSLNSERIEVLKTLGSNIFLFLDPDKAGKEATKDLAKQLIGFNVYVPDYQLYVDGDPAEKEKEEVQKILDSKIPYLKARISGRI